MKIREKGAKNYIAPECPETKKQKNVSEERYEKEKGERYEKRTSYCVP